MLVAAPCEKYGNRNELVVLVEQCEDKIWTLFFDGSKCLQGDGAWIMLVSSKYEIIPMDYKLNFECSNNMIEYKALVLGLKIAINIGISKLKVYGDSQLVINKINDVYNIKDDKL